jgi:hypothetical protein
LKILVVVDVETSFQRVDAVAFLDVEEEVHEVPYHASFVVLVLDQVHYFASYVVADDVVAVVVVIVDDAVILFVVVVEETLLSFVDFVTSSVVELVVNGEVVEVVDDDHLGYVVILLEDTFDVVVEVGVHVGTSLVDTFVAVVVAELAEAENEETYRNLIK